MIFCPDAAGRSGCGVQRLGERRRESVARVDVQLLVNVAEVGHDGRLGDE
jgi:hypothetical protein